MARRKTNKKAELKSKGSARKSKAGPSTEVLDGRDWTVASIAWNGDGNVVILDPKLADFLRARIQEDRELEMGLPRSPVEVGKATDGDSSYDPYPLGDPDPKRKQPPTVLSLCACNLLRFHLVKEIAVNHKLLSSEALH
jgi:hypothetical protein